MSNNLLDRQQLKARLRTYICDVLLEEADYDLRDDQSLVNEGLLDSMSVIDIIVFIEDEFGVFIPNEELDVDNMDTLDQMVDFIISWEHTHGDR